MEGIACSAFLSVSIFYRTPIVDCRLLIEPSRSGSRWILPATALCPVLTSYSAMFAAFLDGVDPGECVCKDPEQSAIAEARVRGRVMKTHPNDQQDSRVTRFFF
jgi:hypothetical protein